MDAADWDRRYETAELLWSIEPNRFVAAELEHVAPGRALDLAAGEGRNAIWLAARGFRVDAVDFSPVALGRARRLAESCGAVIDFAQVDLREWTPEEGAYDLVLVSYLHLPWTQMRAVIGAASRAVAPGGLFLLVGHDRTNLEHGVGGPSSPDVLYGPEDVAGALEGFEIERAERLHRPVQVEGTTRHAIDVLVRAVRRCDV